MAIVKGKSKALSQMNDAKIKKRLTWFRHCGGKAAILAMREFIPDEDPIPRLQVRFKILESYAQADSFEQETGKPLRKDGTPIQPHAVGEVVSISFKFKKRTYGARDAKAFIFAAFNVDPENPCTDEEYESTYMECIGYEADEAKGEYVFTGAQPARGMLVNFRSWWKQSTKDMNGQTVPADQQKWRSNIDFSHAAQTDEAKTALLATLGNEGMFGHVEEDDGEDE